MDIYLTFHVSLVAFSIISSSSFVKHFVVYRVDMFSFRIHSEVRYTKSMMGIAKSKTSAIVVCLIINVVVVVIGVADVSRN